MFLIGPTRKTIGGPRPETWQWLVSTIAAPPTYYTTSTKFFGLMTERTAMPHWFYVPLGLYVDTSED